MITVHLASLAYGFVIGLLAAAGAMAGFMIYDLNK